MPTRKKDSGISPLSFYISPVSSVPAVSWASRPSRKSSAALEKIWDFFHTRYIPSSNLGFRGRKHRSLPVVFTSLSRVKAYTERSLNSNEGWNTTSSLSFMNMPILRYSNEIRSAVLVIHGDKAHSCYFSKDAFADMVKDSPYAGNKELLLIPGAVHTDLYDRKDVIPFDRIERFFRQYLK